MQPVLWDDVRYFLAVQRRGRHKGAARLLRVDPTTVARRIAALEVALGAKLFVRTPERLLPTVAGLTFAVHAARVEAEVLAAERALEAADARLEGAIRITATDGFVHYMLLPALAQFCRAHPALTIDLRTDTNLLDLSRREADVAIRLARPKEPALVARRLGAMPFALFASDSYLERRGAPRSFAALAAHDWIGFDVSLDQLPQVKWLRRIVPRLRYVLRANTTTTQVLTCAEGHGIALLPVFVAAREPRLRRLLPRVAGPTRDLWAVTHADMRANARVEVFIAWLLRLVTLNFDAPG
jgi:DNA-binding transcriptional LysR family regulator